MIRSLVFMNITIEQNQVIVNLDEFEFPKFEAMFANLHLNKRLRCEFREFGFGGAYFNFDLLPMHLCRTIGEANLSADPFATVSLYPFWKHGFAFGNGGQLELNLDMEDPHKKAVAADEFGMGFTAWAMEEIFHCEYWADTSALIKKGAVFPVGSKRPDFVCGFADGSLGIFEAKGTTGTTGNLSGPLADGKKQTRGITATDPISMRVVVGAALGGGTAKVVLLDPPGPSTGSGNGRSVGEPAEPTNLTAKLVAEAAKAMRMGTPFDRLRERPTDGPVIELAEMAETPAQIETIFRGPDGATGATREIKLTNEFKEEKRHGWLEKR